MLKQITIYTGIILCVVLSFLAGSFNGFDIGYSMGTASESRWFISGGTAYGNIAQQYFLIFLACLIYLLLHLAPSVHLWPRILRILVLSTAVLPFTKLYEQIALYLTDKEPFSELIRHSVTINLICLCLIVLLILLEVLRWRRS